MFKPIGSRITILISCNRATFPVVQTLLCLLRQIEGRLFIWFCLSSAIWCFECRSKAARLRKHFIKISIAPNLISPSPCEAISTHIHIPSNSMLAIRQQVLSFLGLEPTLSPLHTSLDLLTNDTLRSFSEPWHRLGRRQVTSSGLTTCGFLDGDPAKPRPAKAGFVCRVDTINALWGTCPATVNSASDCGLAANCIDSYACTNGCGIPNSFGLTTFTW